MSVCKFVKNIAFNIISYYRTVHKPKKTFVKQKQAPRGLFPFTQIILFICTIRTCRP